MRLARGKRIVKCSIGKSKLENRTQKTGNARQGGSDIFGPPRSMERRRNPMWNCDWEYENQETLRQWYEEKISRVEPDSAVRKIICKGCGRVFYTQIASKKYCYYHLCGNRGYQKDLKQRRLEKRQNRICKSCGKIFTPKRSDAVYCSNACRQRAYRQSVTDKASDQIEHLPQP